MAATRTESPSRGRARRVRAHGRTGAPGQIKKAGRTKAPSLGKGAPTYAGTPVTSSPLTSRAGAGTAGKRSVPSASNFAGFRKGAPTIPTTAVGSGPLTSRGTVGPVKSSGAGTSFRKGMPNLPAVKPVATTASRGKASAPGQIKKTMGLKSARSLTPAGAKMKLGRPTK